MGTNIAFGLAKGDAANIRIVAKLGGFKISDQCTRSEIDAISFSGNLFGLVSHTDLQWFADNDFKCTTMFDFENFCHSKGTTELISTLNRLTLICQAISKDPPEKWYVVWTYI